MVFVYTTCETTAEAKKLGSLIISRKVGACVDFWPVESIYMYEGVMKDHLQAILLITTLESKLQEVETIISQNHTYSVPLVAGVDIRRLNHSYKEWMVETMR